MNKVLLFLFCASVSCPLWGAYQKFDKSDEQVSIVFGLIYDELSKNEKEDELSKNEKEARRKARKKEKRKAKLEEVIVWCQTNISWTETSLNLLTERRKTRDYHIKLLQKEEDYRALLRQEEKDDQERQKKLQALLAEVMEKMIIKKWKQLPVIMALSVLIGTDTPSGIVGLFQIPKTPQPQRLSSGIVLANVADPGNMGTLIRTCVAMGCTSVVIVDGAEASFDEEKQEQILEEFKNLWSEQSESTNRIEKIQKGFDFVRGQKKKSKKKLDDQQEKIDKHEELKKYLKSKPQFLD